MIKHGGVEDQITLAPFRNDYEFSSGVPTC